MNPFSDSQSGGRPSVLSRLLARPAPVVFGITLLLGLAVVGWRAKVRADAARAAVRSEARALGTALELQFNQAATAAEVLGALARQGGGTVADFHAVADGLLLEHPGIASLQLQPGGIVSDVAPLAGHELAIGRNVLTDPTQRSEANAALQSHQPTASGPLMLEEGVMGLVLRVPVYSRSRDGRESFRGFAAASVRIPELLARARLDELFNRGYYYAFFKPASSRQKAIGIAATGRGAALRDTVQQPVRLQNLEFRLALQPRAGWGSHTRLGLELLGVVFIAALLALLVNLLENRHALEAALADAKQRLDREAADRKQALEDCRHAKEKSAAVQGELQQRDSDRQAAESAVKDLQARLEAADRGIAQAAETHQAQLAEARQTITELEARLDARARSEAEAIAAAQSQLQQAQETIATLTAKHKAAAHAAQQAAEAQANRLQEAEAAQRVLNRRLKEAEQAEARVVELETFLQQAKAALEQKEPPPAIEPNEAAADAEPKPGLEVEPVTEEPPLSSPPPKALKRKRTKGGNQMDLFQPAPATTEVVDPTPVTVEAGDASSKEVAAPDEAPAAPVTAAPVAEDREAAPTEFADAESGTPAEPADEELMPDASEKAIAAELEPVEAPVADEPAEADEAAPAEKPEKDKPPAARRLPAPPPVNPPQLRKAVNLIMPLLTDQDPGAKDCLKDNRNTFRSAFSAEGWPEFEQLMKRGDFSAALDQLRKAVKKHGLSV